MIELFHYPHYTLETVSTEWDWKTDTIEHHADLEKFEHEMIQFMHDEKGIGLAANQIGITKRFFAIGHESFDTISKPAIIYNPRILKSSTEKVMDVEGFFETNFFLFYFSQKTMSERSVFFSAT